MRNFIHVRPITQEELSQLKAGLRSEDGFVVRRCQILLFSHRGASPSQIAREVGYSDQGIRNIIKAFNAQGVAALQRQSSRPKHVQSVFGVWELLALEELLHHSPRLYGIPQSYWTLELVAQVCYMEGITPRRMSDETIRTTVRKLGHSWKRAKRWITSPDPFYVRKKKARDRLIRLSKQHPDWVLGYLDQTWWSRLMQMLRHTWCDAAKDGLPMERLTISKEDPDPKALACYGLLLSELEDLWLRFVQGRPVSAVTIEFLEWVVDRLEQMGKTALLLILDNATWHKSQRVTTWIKAHNRLVKQTGKGVRIVLCFLPVKSPWLNPIEPKWLHGKRAISEPNRVLSAEEIQQRVHAYYGAERFDPLVQPKPKKVA
jgi:transposase